MELATSVAGIKLEHPLMNAAGTCKTFAHFELFARSAVSAIVVGPITPLERDGNSGDIYYQGGGFSLNSLGMPNPGNEDFFGLHWPRMLEVADESGKPVILQLAGFSPGDYVQLAVDAQRAGIKHIELNFGCPNVWDSGHQHGIISFDPAAIALIVKAVREVFYGTIGLKLSPYSDPNLLEQVAETINGLRVDYVACSNTFPNAMAFNLVTGKPVISVKTGDLVGLAGLGGKAMLPIALGQVYRFANLLQDAAVVGVGGITDGQDIVDFQRAGAVAVQASTVFWNDNEDPGIYSDLLAEYLDVLETTSFEFSKED